MEECPIEAEDYLFPEHKALWRAFRWLYDQGLSVDPPATILALDRMGLIEAVDKWVQQSGYSGIEAYLVYIWDFSFTAKGCGAFLRAVKHYSDMRSPVSPRKREIEI
jgi:replicative DNA helicase